MNQLARQIASVCVCYLWDNKEQETLRLETQCIFYRCQQIDIAAAVNYFFIYIYLQ